MAIAVSHIGHPQTTQDVTLLREALNRAAEGSGLTGPVTSTSDIDTEPANPNGGSESRRSAGPRSPRIRLIRALGVMSDPSRKTEAGNRPRCGPPVYVRAERRTARGLSVSCELGNCRSLHEYSDPCAQQHGETSDESVAIWAAVPSYKWHLTNPYGASWRLAQKTHDDAIMSQLARPS